MIGDVEIRRGDIYYAELPDDTGKSVQKGIRPVLVVQNNAGNKHSPTIIITPLTSKEKKNMPTHVEIAKEGGLKMFSTVLCEQIQTIGKDKLLSYVGRLSASTMNRVNYALISSVVSD